jgi:hypothetical protein
LASQSLNAVLSHPAIWRGGDCAPEPATLPTGHAALDAVLPGGGWPQGALTEILLAREALWAYEQALRAADCGAAFAWLDLTDARMLRRLQVAAREGRTFGVLWRRPGQRSVAAPVPLRLALEPRDGRLAVHVVKRRGAPLAQPVMIDVARAPGTPWIAAEIPEEKRHERPRTSLRHDGVQQRVGEPPPAGGLRQAVAG